MKIFIGWISAIVMISIMGCAAQEAVIHQSHNQPPTAASADS